MKVAEMLARAPWRAAIVAVLLAASGAALVIAARQGIVQANQQLLAARAERAQLREQLVRVTQDEREVGESADLYRRLVELHVVGAERRLEWTESLARIRERRQLAELRYQIAPRRLLQALPGKPGGVDSYASTMKIEMGLLHEGDLFRFLEDLRASGNAYYAVNQCSVARRTPAAPDATLAPRLRAACEIDLITIHDGGSRT